MNTKMIKYRQETNYTEEKDLDKNKTTEKVFKNDQKPKSKWN